MVRSIEARAKLALAFRMLPTVCGLVRREGSAEVCGTVGPGPLHERGDTVGPVGCRASNLAIAFGVRPLS